MIKKLKRAVAMSLGLKEDEIAIKEVCKNNGVTGTGFTLKDKRVSPCVYVDGALKAIENGESIAGVAKEIADIFKENDAPIVNISKEKILKNSIIVLVNADKNREMLKHTPHKRLCDLACVVRVMLQEFEGKLASTVAHNRLLEEYGITEEELFENAMKNTKENSGFSCRPIGDVMAEMSGDDEYKSSPMLVATNKDKTFGASILAFGDMIEEYVRKIGGDVYILPSSVHEILILPKKYDYEVEFLKMMVEDVNRSCVEPSDILSDSVYEYSLEDKQVKLVA